jgi:hypothetical protein
MNGDEHSCHHLDLCTTSHTQLGQESHKFCGPDQTAHPRDNCVESFLLRKNIPGIVDTMLDEVIHNPREIEIKKSKGEATVGDQ